MQPSRKSQPFLRKHSLSLVALGVVLLRIVLYRWSKASTHVGSFSEMRWPIGRESSSLW
jgi:hypothetical protein